KHTEDDPPGMDFLAKVCVAWENEAQKIDQNKCCLLIYRFGTVMGSDGGAFPALVRPVKYFIGAPLGSGRQIFTWIHIHDLSRMIHYGLQNESISGIYN